LNKRLDAHGISWLDYAWDLPDIALFPNRLTENLGKIRTFQQFLGDCQSGALPDVCIVSPGATAYSEENPADIQLGEAYSASVINAVTHSPAWPKTVLLFMYDEHGGYYDHVPPPPAIRPDDIPPDIVVPPDYAGAYDRYGFRVPAVIVSPYARRNYVSHRLHDHTSVLKLIETKWNLPALTFRDANADDLLDSLDLRARPAFAAPPELAPAALENTPDTCVPGSPGGPIPPPDAVVPVSAAPGLRIGAS
jgi:phospholipase C